MVGLPGGSAHLPGSENLGEQSANLNQHNT